MLVRRSLPQIDHARYREIFGFPVRGYYERIGFDLEREPFEELAVEFIAEYQARWRDHELRDDAHEVATALEERGTSQSVLSASEQRLLNDMTAHFAIDSRMTQLCRDRRPPRREQAGSRGSPTSRNCAAPNSACSSLATRSTTSKSRPQWEWTARSSRTVTHLASVWRRPAPPRTAR